MNSEVWLKECRELLPGCYAYDKKIDQAYIDKNKPIIEKQLVKAGLRLAFALRDVFNVKG